VTRGKACGPPPSTQTHTHAHRKTDTLRWDRMEGILEKGMWTDGGTGAKQSSKERLQRERDRRRGRQVRSSRLILFQAPPLRPGVSQPNKPLQYMNVPPTGF